MDRPDAVYHYRRPVVLAGSYLNDVRIDNVRKVAYITDSGDGALIVTDLETGESRRLLDDHPSTGAQDVVISPGGVPWILPGGRSPAIHSDGIALSPSGEYLYYHALTGTTLYRIPTEALLDESLNATDLAAAVETVCETGPVDGMIFGPDGTLFLTLLEENAIGAILPGSDSLVVLARSDDIRWPDSFSMGPDGTLYVTTSQIHLGPEPADPYTILEIPPVHD
jgi:sugar lactone lactonase YvrE